MRIHGMAPALNYGQQALEGLKAFCMPGNPSRITLFRPDRNAIRFQHSAEVLSMPPVPVDIFVQACRAAVALNAGYVPPYKSGGALYVRPQLYGSDARLLPSASHEEYTFCVFVVPIGDYNGMQALKALILDDFDRAAPKGTGHAKVGGNYAPVVRWSERAKAEGFGVTLHLDSTRYEEVDEFSWCAFIGVLSDGADDVTLVVPDSPCVIDSITSDSMQRIGQSYGWKVEKRPIPYTELPMFSEVLAAGTRVALLPVRSITRRRTSGTTRRLPSCPRLCVDAESETMRYLSDEQDIGGPVYLKLQARLKAIHLGKIKVEDGWLVEVRAEDQEVDGGDGQPSRL